MFRRPPVHSPGRAAVFLAVALSACRPPGTSSAPPAPVPAPAPVALVPPFHYAAGAWRYDLASDLVVTISGDSSDATDSLVSVGVIDVQLAGGDSAQWMTGTIDSLTVRSTRRGTAPTALVHPVAFTRSVAVAGDTLVLAVGDTLAACAEDSVAVTSVVADLLPAIAPAVDADTVVTRLSRVRACRGPMPVTIDLTTRPLPAAGPDRAGEPGPEVSYASHLTLTGTTTRAGHPIALTGSGDLTATYALDPVRGVIRTVRTRYHLELTLVIGVTSRHISERGTTRLTVR